MLQGPYPAASAPAAPLPERAFVPAMNRMGVVDLARGKAVKDAVVFAKLVLDVAEAGAYVAMLGADDGVSVALDGSTLYTRDVDRPMREDDDMIPLELTRGRHELVVRLHQRSGAWTQRTRIVGRDLRASPHVAVILPRAGLEERDLLALTSVSFLRGLGPSGLSPRVTVQFPAGLPEGLGVPVRAQVIAGERTVWSAPCGEARVTRGLAHDYDVRLPVLDANDVKGGARLVLEVGTRKLSLPIVLPEGVLRAVARAREVLADDAGGALEEDTRATLSLLAERLERFVNDGDTDGPALEMEAAELARVVDAVLRGREPFEGRTGAMRRAYRSVSDGTPQEVGLYVPPGYDPKRKYPLVVALHGMDGYPMAMLRWFFGKDETGKDQAWEERHPAELAQLGALVLAPNGHGNTMYREQGEDDILAAIDLVKRHYAVDEGAITVTGPSMGGIGAAAVPLHHPDLFAAAAPLCGYHSYFIRRDIGPVRRRPWEEHLVEERSNALWAENGRALPLYIVHGQRDLPVENSQVLIDRYLALGYSVVHEHPDLGHNVWQTSYESFKLGKWLLGKRRTFDQGHVVFKTTSTRQGDVGFVHLDALARNGAWATIDARRVRSTFTLRTKNLRALHLDRASLREGDAPTPVRVDADGDALTFEAGEPLALHREGAAWQKGELPSAAQLKHGHVTGPLRDVFREPVLFVYGAEEPDGALANETVARFFARGRGFVSVRYPVMSDREFLARGERLDTARALFLVGNARENALVRALEPELPLRVEGDSVRIGARAYRGPEVGAAFIRPNPRRPSSYVVVLEAPTPLGTMRAMSLPDILPDFAIYDRGVAPSRGQLLLGAGSLLEGGLFDDDWSVPARLLAREPSERANTSRSASGRAP